MDIKLDLEAAVKEQAGPATAEILALALAQRAKGIAKYGQGAEHARLRFDEWVNHAKEELIDLLVYLLTAADDFESDRNRVQKERDALHKAGVYVVPVLNDDGVMYTVELPKPEISAEHYEAWLSMDAVEALRQHGRLADRITLHPTPNSVRARVLVVIEGDTYEDVSSVSESNE